MLHKHYYILLIISFIALGSCKQKKEDILELPSNTSEALNLKYAEGFTITDNQNFKVVEIKNPWPKADKTYKYVLISKENIAKTSFLKDEYDGIIITPVTKIVVTSTTHIPALELLDKTETLVGFPGTDYVSSKQTRQRIDNGQVKELGKNEGLNTEVLLNLNPDLVIGFGVDGTSKSLNTVKKANIPVIYNGDWVEKSPLAKAEWIKLFGAIFNKQQQADSIFNTIESNYNKAKQLAKTVTKKPTVISGALYKDVWYLPSGTSTEAQLLKDANLDYLYANTNASGSLSLSFEAVFEKAKQANLWISPSYYNSLQSLENANAHYTNFEAFKTKSVFSFTNTVGPTGGVLYYETGFARPDLVLKDLIKIGHPELLNDYETYFFKPLK
ncbi:ABC transporter substrate-binding protein [Mesoflavibacter profundi]|uniref:ABC transporter substrate-binding protein n=1 Tax=Mesoflavibacter profundi TaxID=2708110 RepID=A0ABT4RZI2_9FLAO|nr:ABC transporter substrate-binding protein [Mesoflavibacter profundi]MDA0176976.1 ABC transporter substrate-binding protein [Mesoflavibacter profundi]